MNGFKLFYAALALALSLPSLAASAGNAAIEGRVVLPDPEVVTAPPPRYAGQVGEIAPPDPPVAVIYLEGQFPSATNTPASASLRQQGMQFRPALLPVCVGTTVAFPNDDEFYHNVFSYSKPRRFDLGRYRKDDKPPVQIFNRPGVVKLYCEIHSHMRGVILVLDTPYFKTTDTNGVFRLESLPPGKYVLKAWADEKRVAQEPVELETGKTLHVDFDLKQERH